MSRTMLGWAAAAAVLMAVAFFAGRSLHPESTAAQAFELDAAPYQGSAVSVAGLSKAGFSGFTESDAEGRTVVAGKVISVTTETITIEGQTGQRSTLRLAGAGRPLRLEGASRDGIRPGVTVIVRREPGSDVAAAILIVSN